MVGLEEQEPTEPAYDYAKLVEEYAAIIRGELPIHEAGIDLSQSALQVTPAGCSVDGEGIFVYRRDVWYSVMEYDINGDGIKELITFENSMNNDSPISGVILDIFTFYNGKPIWLIAGAERGIITLCKNGIIYERASGGAEAIGTD